MKKTKKEIIYCVFCGTQNKIDDKRCLKCHKKLDPKENLVIDYLGSHIQDEFTGKIEEGVIQLLISYIKSHLYGSILTMSLIISAALGVTAALDTPRYEIVSTPPQIASCIPKKFEKQYSYVYETNDECISNGNNAFIEVYENIDDSIFTYSCEEIVDDCGKVWYGVYFNRWSDQDETVKVYH